MIDADGNWNGVCACGKIEADGKPCILGATHQPRNRPQLMPWEIRAATATVQNEIYAGTASNADAFPSVSTKSETEAKLTLPNVLDTPWTPPWEKNETESGTKKIS